MPLLSINKPYRLNTNKQCAIYFKILRKHIILIIYYKDKAGFEKEKTINNKRI